MIEQIFKLGIGGLAVWAMMPLVSHAFLIDPVAGAAAVLGVCSGVFGYVRG